ncbi:DSC E3 ubiquitin ligase complex subunit 1 [Lasiodiplodia hormozganensis]|uniref:DSC E3 ubiquitin ligase complex subunit A n=1 Tax=Lasiodiplodia hormozganensis TaxID=869390 RepID=A0AA39YVV3_9PEZI|nr:DSC E3 ubiquitin ligase complex subunit 1 [Lasiodiplodia hormozganensis]
MANNPPPFLFLLVIFLFLYLSPDPQAPVASRKLERIVEHERAALTTLNNSTFGDLQVGVDDEERWLNLTGLKKEHGFHWELLDPVRDRVRDQAHYVLGEDTVGLIDGSSDRFPPVYHNITGFVQGTWRSIKTYTGPHLNLSAVTPHGTYSSEEWTRNVTAAGGDIRIHFGERDHGEPWNTTARRVAARVTIGEDTSYGNWWDMRLHGFHLEDTGTIVLTTTSEKFDGIFALPHFTLSKYAFTLGQELLNRTLNATIEKQKSGELEDFSPWSSIVEGEQELFSLPHCEYVMYLQQHPLPIHLPESSAYGNGLAMKFFEDELRNPYRISPNLPPEMVMSMVAFSPDCGFIIESSGPPDVPPQEGKHLVGPKTEAYAMVARRHIILFALVIGSQLVLLVRQMKEASTPSTRSRISFYTIALLALGDGFTLLGFAFVGMSYEAITLILLATAYVAFLSAVFFGMGFLKEIWTVQSAERGREERRSNATSTRPTPTATQPGSRSETPASAPVISAAGADTLPLPVTSRQAINSGATPIIVPSDQDVDAEIAENENNANATDNERSARYGFGTVYFRFYLLLFGLVFLSLHATTWPSSLQAIYSTVLIFTYFSFWTPQIYRNIMRNCRRALRWDYVVGQSVLRLLPFYYLFAYRGNILLLKPDYTFLLVLTGWVWLQVCALFSQEHLGPRFFVRDSWVPPAYDYHPVLRADEEGASLPSGGKVLAGEDSGGLASSATKAGESRDKGKKVFDCAICMQDLEVPVVPGTGSGGSDADSSSASALSGGLLARRAYMVTPCRHIFHSVCLEGWMRYRLQCPICRETLPPL